MKTIPLTKPYMIPEIKEKVCEVLDSGHLTEGKVTESLEKAFTDYLGTRYAIATTSCTTGLEIALRAIGVGPGDEVIVPDFTYPATACVVRIVGAKLVVVDVDPKTMLIDYDALEAAVTRRTKALMPVSLFGNPLDYGRLNKIKKRHGIVLVEDAACSIGAEYDGVPVGNLADISVFSMHPRKFITTGEGGMVTTNRTSLADWISSYKHFGLGLHGKSNSPGFQMIGTNYKLSDILSAVGLVQMAHIGPLLEQRREQAARYVELLKDVGGVCLPETTLRGQHSYQSFCIFVEKRDAIMQRMRQMGIEVQIGTYALHMQKAFLPMDKCAFCGDMNHSKYVFEHGLTLPLFHEMTEKEQERVVDALKETLRETARTL